MRNNQGSGVQATPRAAQAPHPRIASPGYSLDCLLFLSLLLPALILGGCSSSTHYADGTPRTERASGFDASDDPPFQPRTHYAAAMLAESQGDVNSALAHYRLALDLDPKFGEAMFRLALLNSSLGRHQPAIDLWRQYIALAPQDAAGEANLGYSLELAGASAEAEAAYLRAIAIDSRNEAARINLGLLLVRQLRDEEALEHLLAVLPPGKAHYNIASEHEREGLRNRAVAAYRRALSVAPELTAASQRLAALEATADDD